MVFDSQKTSRTLTILSEKIDLDYTAILWHALILNIMVLPVHLRNCATQRQKQEKEKVKKKDQKYKVVSSQEIM